jgi:hypothetical protein
MCIIPVVRRLRQEDHRFQASLGHTVRLCLKKPPKNYKFLGAGPGASDAVGLEWGLGLYVCKFLG